MRKAVISGLLFASSVLTACTSSNSVDSVMALPPSSETTASVSLPKAEVPGLATQNTDVAAYQQPLPAPLEPGAEQAGLPVQVASTTAILPAPDVKPTASPQKPKPASLFSGTRNRFADLKVYPPKFSDAKPVNFGKASPHPFEVHGVDVSHWQADIDWKKLRTQGANFAFIKATEGGKHVDRLFKKNWKEAHEAGIPTGAYHFMYWCRSAEEQADWFIRHVPKQAGSLPPVLDVEWHGNRKTCPHKISKKRVLEKMNVWMDKIEKHYGVKPIIYTAPDFYEDNLQGQFKDHSFWLRSVAEHPKGRYPNRDFAFWQYSGTGLMKGVSTQIDHNVFNGTEESWKRWLSERVQ